MEASVAIQSLPAVADDEELCRIVDEVIAYIASSGFNYFVGPFETTIEGPYDELERKPKSQYSDPLLSLEINNIIYYGQYENISQPLKLFK